MGGRFRADYTGAMLSVLLVAVAATWVSGTILTIVHLRRAPFGIEDETGFHAFEPTEPQHERAAA